MDYIKFLEWDTNFFGKNTGIINNEIVISTDNRAAVRKEIDDKKLEFVYYFQDTALVKNFNILFQIGFKLIDIELVLHTNFSKEDVVLAGENEQFSLIDYSDHKEYKKYNIDKIKDIFNDLSTYSRFYRDEYLDKTFSAKLYERWFENSISGKFSDYFYIIGPKQDPKGMTVCKKIDDKEIDISLIAIDANSRGNNLGKKIMVSTLNDLYDRGFRKARIKVHISNPRIIAFCNTLGFKILKSRFIFHYHKH